MDNTRIRGFTLLEIIIALAIFAVVMVLVSGGLGMVVRAQEQISMRDKRLGELQFAMLIMSRDLEQIVNRPVIGNSGGLQNAIQVLPGEDPQLVFTRGGVINPGAMYQRSTMQRVGYGLSNKKLTRYSWAVLDRLENSMPTSRPILEDVESFKVESLNERGELININTAEGQTTPPLALVITINLGREGSIRRTYALPGAFSNVGI